MHKYDRGEWPEYLKYMAQHPYIEILDFDDRALARAIIKFKINDTEHEIIKSRSGAWYYRGFLDFDDQSFNRLLNSISYSEKHGCSLTPGKLVVSVFAKLASSFKPHIICLKGYSMVSFDDVFKINFSVSGMAYIGDFKYLRNSNLVPVVCDDYCLRKFHEAEREYILSELTGLITERFDGDLKRISR